MAKKTTLSNNKIKNVNEFLQAKNVQIESISRYNVENMKKFGMNINIARNIPWYSDGLKPVERRVIYTHYLLARKDFVKAARLVGDCMGKFHPHGDSSIYSVMVRLAQPWQNIIPALTGSGNYGNAGGSDAAAMRYTNFKLSKYSNDCFFSDFDPDLVDMYPNYEETTMEPFTLPAKYPNVLINNASGMSFGIATNIPSFSIKDVLDYTIKLISDPKCKDFIVPESPTECLIVDDGKFKDICNKGEGTFRMRGEIIIDLDNHSLVIESVPYQVSLTKVKEKIGKLIEEKKFLQGFVRMADHTAKEKVYLELFFKKEVDLDNIRKILYKKTQLEEHYPVQIKVIKDFQVKSHSVRSLLLDWIDYRRDFKRKYYNIKIVKTKEREHILDILLFILNKDNAENTIKIMRKSENKAEAVAKLVEVYKITTLQAKIIADMRLHEFSKEAVKGYHKEKGEIQDTINGYMKKITNPSLIDKKIIEELEEGIKKYGVARKCKVIKVTDDNEIPDTNHVIIVTKKGFIKKVLPGIKNVGYIAEGDEPTDILNVNNKETIVIFDSKGNVHMLPVNNIISCDLRSQGMALDKYVKLSGHVLSLSVIDEGIDSSESYFLFTTKLGMIKKTKVSNFATSKNSLIGILLKEEDEVVTVDYIKKDIDIIVYTAKGQGLRFNTSDITPTGRMSQGVMVFSIDANDLVFGATIIKPTDKYIFMLSNRGYGKKCALDNLKTESRRSGSLKMMNVGDDDILSYMYSISGDEQFSVVLPDGIIPIDMRNVPELMRMSKGTSLLGVRNAGKIIKVYKK